MKSPDAFRTVPGSPKTLLEDGQTIDLGGRTLEVIHSPGHRLRDTRPAQHLRERRLNVTRRHPVYVHPRDQFIEFFGRAYVGIENLD